MCEVPLYTSASRGAALISPKVFIKLFCKSQFPQKSVILFYILVIMKANLTDLCGDRLVQNDDINTLCEMITRSGPRLLTDLCRANMAHVRRSKPDHGLGVLVKAIVPFSTCSFFDWKWPGGLH